MRTNRDFLASLARSLKNQAEIQEGGSEIENEWENSTVSVDISEKETVVESQDTGLRRSQRLTKTNPIVRLNHPVNYDYCRQHRKAAQRATGNGRNLKHDRPISQTEDNEWNEAQTPSGPNRAADCTRLNRTNLDRARIPGHTSTPLDIPHPIRSPGE